MTKKLFFQAVVKYLAGVALLGVLLFLPAGTLRFPNGWLLMALLFIPMLCAGVAMMLRDPALLEKRLNAKERESEQKDVILKSGLMFIAAFVVAGLNFRFGWLKLPSWVVWAASAIFLLAYLMWGEVLRENAWLSRTVEVQEGQLVVDHGLYGVVRHPMYAASLLLYLPLIAKRIRSEEKILKKGLEGYAEYCERVKYRLIPFVW